MLTATISRPCCFFVCVKLLIHYLTYGFRPVISTCQNLLSRGLPILGSFYKLLRNVVTETFAESSENWEVSSNRILTGRSSFITVKLVIHYMMYGFRPVSSTCQNVRSQERTIFRTFCRSLRNFVTKTFQPCSRRIPVMRVCKGFRLFLTYGVCYLERLTL